MTRSGPVQERPAPVDRAPSRLSPGRPARRTAEAPPTAVPPASAPRTGAARPRPRHAVRRPARRHHARRLRRRGHQDRAPAKPRPLARPRAAKDGVGLWWKLLGRNKRTITARPVHARRPGPAPRGWPPTPTWSSRTSAPAPWRGGTSAGTELRAANPRLVLARVTGFGQFGPYAHRPGFGTLAEAMSGFAAITGEPDGPPTLPPFGLADSSRRWPPRTP